MSNRQRSDLSELVNLIYNIKIMIFFVGGLGAVYLGGVYLLNQNPC